MNQTNKKSIINHHKKTWRMRQMNFIERKNELVLGKGSYVIHIMKMNTMTNNKIETTKKKKKK